MTDRRDPQLQSLFTEANRELDGKELTAQVMRKTRLVRYRAWGGVTLLVLLVLLLTWQVFAMPLFDFALMMSQVVTTNLIDLGGGWMELALLPLNSIGGLAVISFKVVRVARKKLMSGSLAF